VEANRGADAKGVSEMCAHGTVKMVKLNRPREVSGRTVVPVDACIADEVQALNDAGVHTLGSCCGHGETDRFPHVLIHPDSTELAKALGYNPEPYETGCMIMRLKTEDTH
jgi:hypothetical protein